MCQRVQNSLKLFEKYGVSKLTPKSKPSIRASPMAMSE